MWVFEDKLTKAELTTFTELGILSLVHISGLTLWTLKEKRRANQQVMLHGHWRRWSQWPLTSSRSCLMGSPSWRSASDRKSPVWSIQVRKSWASRCRRWPAPVPPAAGQYSIMTHYKSSRYKGQQSIRGCINTCVWQQVIILQRSEKFGFIISELEIL